jgi:hypothetical protein
MARTAAAPAAQSKALATVVMTDDELTATLRELGLLETPQGDGNWPQRAKVEGSTIYLGDDMYVSNPKTKTPAMRVRLLGLPAEYQGIYIPRNLALHPDVNRPDIADKYCKSHFDVETEKREFSEDGTSCRGCPISPFTKRDNLPVFEDSEGRPTTRKCQWRAEVSFQVLDHEGAISDPTVWVLDLSTTSVIEFKGTGKEAQKGAASEFNFIHKLARFGAQLTPENPNEGLRTALTAYRLGGVICDVFQLPMRSDDGSRSWYVTSFTPVDIIDVDEAPALEAGDAPEGNPDDLPF